MIITRYIDKIYHIHEVSTNLISYIDDKCAIVNM